MEDATIGNCKDVEAECVKKARDGDRSAFEELMNLYRKDIYNLAYRMSGNHHDADDIAQETFVRAYLSLRKFRGSSAFRTWLYSIAINTARTIATHAGRIRKVELPLLEEAADANRSIPDAETSHEMKELLAGTITQLPNRQKEVLILKIFHGMKHVEIAKALGISAGAAKANLFHAIRFLRIRLRND